MITSHYLCVLSLSLVAISVVIQVNMWKNTFVNVLNHLLYESLLACFLVISFIHLFDKHKKLL